MKRLLIVVDYQNDFVAGALGFEKAKTLEPYIASLIEQYKKKGDDVIFTIENLSKIDSIYLENIRHITEINRVDDNTIRLILDQEVPFFEYNLIFPILSKKNYEGQDFIYGSSNNAPIGTGKYKITQNSSDSIILEKNENYKRAELTLEKITISKYSNVGEMYNSFKLGKID